MTATFLPVEGGGSGAGVSQGKPSEVFHENRLIEKGTGTGIHAQV